jgi:4-amino-4-deoxy-L-arabinose transferase-like glycosyltransferase
LSASGTADRAATVLVGVLSAFTVLLHLLTAGRYGIFRDELYYIACARHLAFGYVDHPPLIALTTWAVLHSLGSSLLALRMLPALAAGVLVWLTAQLAREMGGGGFAQSMAAFAIVPVPIYLILHHWLTMNAFEPLFWMGVVWAALRMVRRQQPQYWLVIGALVGLGLENKYSMLLPAVGLLLGMLLTPERQWLKSRWFAVAALLALLLFLPNFLWLVRNHFPFLEFERHSRASGSRILRGPLEFLADQALIMNPVLAPLASAGLLWLVFSKSARMFRFAGWTAFFVLTVLMVVQAKNYYAAPVYPVLFAAGAIALEKATEVQLGWIRPACASLLLFSGILLAPLVMPLLSVPHFLAYSRLWHGFTPVRFEALPVQPLPQYFADEFGWEDMVRVTAKVFAILPAEERRRTAIFANNYGEAAAIDFFGPAYGLPAAIGKNETYWLWGPRDYTGSTVIVLGSDGVGDREVFRSVEVVGRVDNPYSRENEHFDVFLCRGLKVDFPALWQRLKAW